jgi:23S rRNA pseudouridine2605 synthase
MVRLQKFISNSGYTSRRKAEELISKGLVKVDGVVVTELGTKVTGKEMIEVEGHILEKEEKVYYVLNKPSGYITAVEDDKGRRVVTDLISTDKRVFPVGRLDYDTTGVLFLTNDGEFSQSMTSPDFKIEKEYIATMKGRFNSYHRRMLMNGVDIGGYVTKKAKIDIINYDKKTDKTQVGVIITEGKYHQVKKMFETQGFIVSKLKRVRFGVITDRNIRIGDYRRIKPHEIKQLYELSKRGK